MSPTTRLISILLILILSLTTLTSTAAAKESAYQTGVVKWHAATGAFSGWVLDGILLNPSGELVFDPANSDAGSDPYSPGTYYGGNFYNGGDYFVGEALSPRVPTSFPFWEAIASWNAATPAGTWLEVQIQAEIGGRLTKWYNLGIWAADTSTIERHSVRLQGDGDGYVAVDTLVLTDKKAGSDAFYLKVRLFSEDNAASASVKNMALAYSTPPLKKLALQPGDSLKWNRFLNVQECSQMVYPDGGEVWCSPTSTSMVVAYWEGDAGPCEPKVRAAVDGVYDWIYDGHGNWPFNTAYAAARGLEGYVARFSSLAEAEDWIYAGVPVIVSYAWGKNDLDGAPIPSSGGHLAVLVGFDANGNPVINDPAAPDNDSVQRVYNRTQFETQWLTTSGGTVYLIYPPGWITP